MYGAGTSPSTEEMLMIRPFPAARMCGRTAFVIRTSPKKLISKTRWSWATELFLRGPGCAGARVVDQHVEPPEPLDYTPDRRADRLVTGHVEIEERHLVQRRDARGVPTRADHLESGIDQRERGCFPNARGGARHECYWLSCCHRGLLT